MSSTAQMGPTIELGQAIIDTTGVKNAPGVTGFPTLTFTSTDGVNLTLGVAGGTLTLSGAAVAASAITGTTLASNVVASSLTSVGILTAPQLHSYLKASLPAATTAGKVIYVSDATALHGTGTVAFSNGTAWIDVTTSLAVV